jgi:hypothetical protein
MQRAPLTAVLTGFVLIACIGSFCMSVSAGLAWLLVTLILRGAARLANNVIKQERKVHMDKRVNLRVLSNDLGRVVLPDCAPGPSRAQEHDAVESQVVEGGILIAARGASCSVCGATEGLN